MKAIDLFAGAGGFSTGARQAGADVIFAANHWPDAVRFHAANHPETAHACQDLQQCDWSTVPAHDLLLASPCCQGFTKARGKNRPQHDASRSTAWAVVSCAEHHTPRFLVVENVPEFMTWNLFPAWKLALEIIGYKLTFQTLNASEFGVAQNRERLFIVGALDQVVSLTSPGLAPVAAETIVDWFDRRFAKIAPGRFGDATAERIRRGREQHGDRFAVAYYGSERGGRSIQKPLGTVTTKDRHLIVDGDRAKILHWTEARRAMGFPDDYKLPNGHAQALKMLGNAVVPQVACSVVQQIMRIA